MPVFKEPSTSSRLTSPSSFPKKVQENSGLSDRTSMTLMSTGRASNRFNGYYFPGTRWVPEGRGCCSGSCHCSLREKMGRRNLTISWPFLMRPVGVVLSIGGRELLFCRLSETGQGFRGDCEVELHLNTRHS